MDKKTVTYIVLLLIVAFFMGRFSAPEKIKIEEKKITVEIEKKSEAASKDFVVISTTIEKPDGTKVTRTKKERKSDTFVTNEIEKKESTSLMKEVTLRRGVVVSGIASVTFPLSVAYGVMVQKQVLGPINLGAFGLTNKTFGISAGLEF